MNIFELIASLKKLVQSLGKKSAFFRSTYISKLDVNQSRKLEPDKKRTKNLCSLGSSNVCVVVDTHYMGETTLRFLQRADKSLCFNTIQTKSISIRR
jgi:hypothetical protein